MKKYIFLALPVICAGFLISPRQTRSQFNGVISQSVTFTQASAPTVAPTFTQATTGGPVAAGTYRYCVTYFTTANTETLCSPDTTSTITTTGTTSTFTINPPAFPPGPGTGTIVGYRVYVSSSGGGTGSETLQTISAATCSLSSSSTASCALTSSWTVPSSGLVSGSSVPAATTAFSPNSGSQPGIQTLNTATFFNVGMYQMSWTSTNTTSCTIQMQTASTLTGSYSGIGSSQSCGTNGSTSFYVTPAASNAFLSLNVSALANTTTSTIATLTVTINAFPNTAIAPALTTSQLASSSAGAPAAGGTCTTPAVAAGSTDMRGQVSSASCTASQTMTATFKQPYAVAPFCTVSPANAAAAVTASAAAVTFASASTTVLTVTSPAAASTAGAWNYVCVE